MAVVPLSSTGLKPIIMHPPAGCNPEDGVLHAARGLTLRCG
jgi:hypothetical protein